MASHQLIDTYTAALSRTLPAGTVEELTDGLIETWQHYQRQGMSADRAAQAAIAEFGTTQQVNHAFVAGSRGQRTARLLLATGPIVGLCWGTSLIAAKVWTWPVPRTAAIAYAVLLLATVSALVIAASTRHHLGRTKLGNAGAAGLLLLDAAMLAAVLIAAPQLVWPMAIAIPISLARMAVTTESVTTAARHRRT